jgi:parvulin-like peptidyl-prolyl isomerase
MKINYSQGVITPEEIIKFLSLTGRLQSVNHEIIKHKEVMKKAKELDLSVSTDELQKYADNFRGNHGLYSSEQTIDFLERGGLTEDDFESYCEARLLTEKLMNHLADQKTIDEYFVNNHSDFDLARIYRIVVSEKSLADEILIQIQEEGKDFHAGAKQYSTDESTKYGGGYCGLITRNLVQPEVAAKVFNASAGDVLGPFEREGLFELIMVEQVIRAELNTAVKERIKKLIFEEWLMQSTRGGVAVSS